MGAEGLIHFNGNDWQRFDKQHTGIPLDSVTSIVRDGNGQLWVGFRGGLATYNGQQWKTVEALKGRCVTSLCIQGIGILWAGVNGDSHGGGLVRIEKGSIKYFTPENSGIPSSRISAIAIDPEQHIWVAASDYGISRFDEATWKNLSYKTLGVQPASMNCISSDPSGTIWAGTSLSQLVRIDDSGFTVLNTGTGAPITSLILRKDASVWIGTTGNGILHLQDGIWNSYTRQKDHLPSDTILCLGKHPDGRILASFDNGNMIIFNEQLNQ
jgi:ligand-binding sensor domain-containing protein